MTMPSGFTIRPPRDGDADTVAELANEEADALVGFRPESADSLRSWWTSPSADRESDFGVVEAPDGSLCAWLGVAADPPYSEVLALGGVALHQHGRGLGSALVAESERRGLRFATLAQPESRVVIQQGALADEPRASSLFQRLGYREIRRFELMRAEFGGEVAPAPTPAGFEVRTIRPEDEAELYLAHTEAFADHWGEGMETEEDFRHDVLGSPRFDPGLWFLVWTDGELAGYLGAHEEAEEDPQRGYVALLGVRPAFRGRGLGEALLRHAFRELAARGKRGCDLHVDADSLTGATRLYERVGMTARPRFAVWEKELRPAAS